MIKELHDFDKFTDEQVRVMNLGFDTLVPRFHEALTKALEAHSAIVPLPHVNEKGVNTIVLCNNLMYSLYESYVEEARVLYYRATRFPDLTNQLQTVREEFVGKIRLSFC